MQNCENNLKYQEYFKPCAHINCSIICLKEESKCQISYRISDGSKNLFLEFETEISKNKTHFLVNCNNNSCG